MQRRDQDAFRRFDLIRCARIGLNTCLMYATMADEETGWRQLLTLDGIAREYLQSLRVDDGVHDDVVTRDALIERIMMDMFCLLASLKTSDDAGAACELLEELTDRLDVMQEQLMFCVIWTAEDMDPVLN